MSSQASFHEGSALSGVPIRDLGLSIAGTRLEPIVEALRGELNRAGLTRLRPRFYLSTEWGVPMGSVAIAIPFYLARPDLTELHRKRTGHIEGSSAAEILRYLRHEAGHAVSYAYLLYEEKGFIERFGSMTQPYIEEYRPAPFCRRHVSHLPGWYAQKHPDEDWAETFAVWLTPGLDWRSTYAAWPEALEKLEYCDRTIAAIRDKDPIVSSDELDEDVGEIEYSLDDYYKTQEPEGAELPAGIDGALRAIFEDLTGPGEQASRFIRDAEPELLASVYRFTGLFPERTRALLYHLAARADALGLPMDRSREREALVALTAFVTALAMNRVVSGSYLP
jgi:hypothetical protein